MTAHGATEEFIEQLLGIKTRLPCDIRESVRTVIGQNRKVVTESHERRYRGQKGGQSSAPPRQGTPFTPRLDLHVCRYGGRV